MESYRDFMDGKSVVFHPEFPIVESISQFDAHAVPRTANVLVGPSEFACPFPSFVEHGFVEFATKFLSKDVSTSVFSPAHSFCYVRSLPFVKLSLGRYMSGNERVEFFRFKRGRSMRVFEPYCHISFQLPLRIISSALSLIARSVNSFPGAWLSIAIVERMPSVSVLANSNARSRNFPSRDISAVGIYDREYPSVPRNFRRVSRVMVPLTSRFSAAIHAAFVIHALFAAATTFIPSAVRIV